MAYFWIKFFPKIDEGDMGDSLELIGLFSKLLANAKWKSQKVNFDGHQVQLEPGQMIFSIRRWAHRLSIDRSKLKRLLDYLEKSERIVSQKRARGIVVTICNWDLYQNHDGMRELTSEPIVSQLPTNSQPIPNQYPTSPPEYANDSDSLQTLRKIDCKKDRKIEICIPPNPKFEGVTDFDLQITDQWLTMYYDRFPKGKTNRMQAADAIRKLRKIDGLTEDEITGLLEFVKTDSFWSTNAYSPLGLRTKGKNGLRKFENIRAAMGRQDSDKLMTDEQRDAFMAEE